MKTIRALLAGTLLALTLTAPVFSDPGIDGATNAYRGASGLSALTTSAALTSVAGTRVQQITTNFAHPSSWQWMFDAIPGCESAIGENIAWHTSPVPAGWPVSAWLASPTHKANIVGNWTHQGSSLLTVGGRVYAVQLFIRTCSGTIVPQPQQPPIVDEIPDTAMEQPE